MAPDTMSFAAASRLDREPLCLRVTPLRSATRTGAVPPKSGTALGVQPGRLGMPTTNESLASDWAPSVVLWLIPVDGL